METVKNVLAESETSTSTAGVRARPGLGLEGGLVIVVVVCGLDLECHRETEDRDCLVGVGSKSERNPLTRPENFDGRREF